MAIVSGCWSAIFAAELVRFSDEWMFKGSDVQGAEELSFNDGSRETVYLPHPMSLVAPDGQSPTGDIWYRKTFSAEEYSGKKVVIEFLGAMQTAEVYLNGDKLITHLGGYDPFAFDISDKLNYSESNVIAVKLNNSASVIVWETAHNESSDSHRDQKDISAE